MPESREDRIAAELKIIGSRLRRERRTADLTQVELAAVLTKLTGKQVSGSRVCEIEMGRTDPKIMLHETWVRHCREVAEKLDKA